MTTHESDRRDHPEDRQDGPTAAPGGSTDSPDQPRPVSSDPDAGTPTRPAWLREPDDDSGPDTDRPTSRRPGHEASAADDDELTSTATRRQGFLGRTNDEHRTGSTAGTTGETRTTTSPAHAAPLPSSSSDATSTLPRSSGTTRATGPGGAAAATDRDEEPRRRTTDAGSDTVLDGATEARPRSRAGAHWWSLLLTLLLTPVAWYLVADGGARLTLGENSPWETGEVVPSALIELVAGLVVAAVVLLAARWSALGAIVVGTIVLLAGLAFVVVPGETATALEPVTGWLEDLNAFGGNVAHHLLQDGPSGRIALYGLALLLTGIVAAGARRAGRGEERRREAYARTVGGRP